MANATPSEVASKYAAARAAKTDPKKVGFERPEMHSIPLAGTVKYYEQHVFLASGDGKKWPAKVEKSASTGLPARLAAAIQSEGGAKKTNFMLCDLNEAAEGDVLVFPDMVKYKLQPSDDVTAFVKSVMHPEGNSAFSSERITGTHVFICTHNSRDARCGYCGPLLVAAFEEAVKEKGLAEEIHIRGCSHTGGHKYAGNVLIYGERGGKVEGDWYGYVTPADIPTLLNQHIRGGEIVENLWRGRMGLTEDEQKEELKRVAASRGAEPSGTAGGVCEGCDCGKVEGKMEATRSGITDVPAQPSSNGPSPSDPQSVFSSTIAGGPVQAKPTGQNNSTGQTKSTGQIKSTRDNQPHVDDRKSALPKWVPTWVQNLEQKDVALGTAVVVTAGIFLVWLNMQRRSAQ